MKIRQWEPSVPSETMDGQTDMTNLRVSQTRQKKGKNLGRIFKLCLHFHICLDGDILE